ncbi:MAG TPA: rod shape-determining protein MreC [Atopostipes sp.]|nr:rod shape-determining protein MreC [Atopostipes sp.]
MKQFFNNKKLITLLVSFIIFIGILWFSFSNFGTPPVVQQLTSDVTAVMGRIFSKPANALNNFFSDINYLEDTFKENKRLKEKVDSLAESQAELSVLREENVQLKSELDLRSSLTEYSTMTGTVISRNPDAWVDQVIVDRGSMDGLERGMSVMSKNGLVGRISEVSPTSSKVTLLSTTAPSSILTSTEIMQEEETIFGVLTGFDLERNELVMEQITSEAAIEIGKEVITSGLGGLVPRGLLVGTITEISLDSQGLGQRVYIEPATDFTDIQFVTIINRIAESPEFISEESE